MIWQQTPYTIPLITASALSIVLAIYILYYHRSRVGLLSAGTIMATSEWMLIYALELASADLSTKILWNKLQFLGVVVIPTGWLLFVFYYTGREKLLMRRTVALLSIVPVFTLFFTFTNEYHGLMWKSFSLDKTGPFVVLRNPYGLWWWVFIGYSYMLMFIGAFKLIKMFIHSHSLYRWQTSALLFGVFSPFIAVTLIASGLNPFPYVSPIPFSFIITNFTVAFSMIYLRLGDIAPLAREIVVERMNDCVIVLDRENRVVDVNPSAQQLIGSITSPVIGEPVEQVWPEGSSQIELGNEASTGKEILLDHREGQRIYDVNISPLTDWRSSAVGWIVVLRDVTDRKRSEKIKASLEEKEILLREIHHRVKNNLQIISSLLRLQSRHIKDKKYTEMIKESQNRIKSMALVHEKLYQSENLANIKFNEYIKVLAHELVQSYGANTDRIAVELDVDEIFLDIDTAIPCGLIINELVSNALKHAFPNEREGEIKITLRSVGGKVEFKRITSVYSSN